VKRLETQKQKVGFRSLTLSLHHDELQGKSSAGAVLRWEGIHGQVARRSLMVVPQDPEM
jgi:hypothetical protein